jgi:hypothetical protein
MEEAGTFLVTHADERTAVLRDVADGRTHPLASNPGVGSEALEADQTLEAGEVLDATIAPEPPLAVAWRIVEIDERRSPTVERSPEPPTAQEHEIAAEQGVGELTVAERAGVGELHVLTVEPGQVERAVADVLTDEATLERAARLGVVRVAVRASEDGVVSVRYLP